MYSMQATGYKGGRHTVYYGKPKGRQERQDFTALYVLIGKDWSLCFSANSSIHIGLNVKQTIESMAVALADEGLKTKIVQYKKREAVPIFLSN